MDLLIDIIGWIGAAEILCAYGLNSFQKLKSDSPIYYFLNLTGGVCFVIYTLYKQAYASAFVNIIWVLIAAIAIGKLMVRQPSNKK
jgi:hypothetical protein